MHIKVIHGRQILDSRGKPTIEVELTTADGVSHRAAVPSGASTGIHEALELRDGDPASFLGQGVLKAVSHVNQIIGPQLVERGFDVREQEKIDRFMIDLDGTPNKVNLGANAILGVSLAVAVAGAHAGNIPLYRHIAVLSGTRKISLPVPAFNIINGGAHAGNLIPFQEFMIIPSGAHSFSEAVQIGSEIYSHLKNHLKKTYGQNAINVGDEGGFAAEIATVDKCLELIMGAVKTSGHEGKVKIGLDVAASEFFKAGAGYDLNYKSGTTGPYLSGQELAKIYQELARNYPIVSIEDAFEQDDFESWSYFNSQTTVQLVGDDLTVTNIERIRKAVKENACNALLLKVNQIGTLTESIQAANMARSSGWNIMVSHRSGETEDTFIADLAVGLGAGQIKAGAPCRSERLAKYNRLLRIEEELGQEAILARPSRIA